METLAQRWSDAGKSSLDNFKKRRLQGDQDTWQAKSLPKKSVPKPALKGQQIPGAPVLTVNRGHILSACTLVIHVHLAAQTGPNSRSYTTDTVIIE